MNVLRAFCNFNYWQSRCYLLVIVACLSLACARKCQTVVRVGLFLCLYLWLYVRKTAHSKALGEKPTKGDRRRRARKRYRHAEHAVIRQAIATNHARTTCLVPALRSLILATSALIIDPSWLILSLAPILPWLLQLLILRYPYLAHQPEVQAVKSLNLMINQALMLALMAILGTQIVIYLSDLLSNPQSQALLAAGSVIISHHDSRVVLETKVDSEGNESYHATLEGQFQLSVSASDGLRRRLLILFLRLLSVPGVKLPGRPTRDGRTPFVSGSALAKAYGVQQSKISRWERYWLEADWRRLLSERAPDVLTLELQDQIVAVFAQFPWWGRQKVYHYLNQQGVKVSHRQVRQAAEESGWNQLRQQLQKRFAISASSFRPRDEWLVSQLLKTNEELIKQLEDQQALPAQLELQIRDLKELATQNGIQTASTIATLPWMLRVQQILFGQWELISDDQECCCTYCGSNQVSRKSRGGQACPSKRASQKIH